ncbi:putative bifunctional inhibitor/plant lipid transfer protein/seed storage helical [Dioscorea sansibarensis]
MASSSSLLMLFKLLLIAFLFVDFARSDFTADQAECTNQLVGLASCLLFVQKIDIQSLTPDCCDDFRKVVRNSFKCLCVLIEDRDEPQLGIKVNITRALILPAKCNAPANVSDCPRVLKLPLDSSQAKDFKQFSDEMQGMGKSAEDGTIRVKKKKTIIVVLSRLIKQMFILNLYTKVLKNELLLLNLMRKVFVFGIFCWETRVLEAKLYY